MKNLYTENWTAATSLFAPGTFGYTDESAKFAYDPDKSNSLLDEAGLDRARRRRLPHQGRQATRRSRPTSTSSTTPRARCSRRSRPSSRRSASSSTSTRPTTPATSAKTARTRSVAAVRTGWPGPDPAINLRNTFSPDGWDVLPSRTTPASTSELHRPARRAAGRGDARSAEVAALQKAEDYLLDQAYSIPLLNDSQVYVAGKRVHGFDLNDGGLPEYHNAWVTD